MDKLKQFWPIILGFVALVVLGAIGTVFSSQRTEEAEKAIEKFVNEVRVQLDDLESRLPPPRSTNVVRTISGNASVDYVYVEWVLIEQLQKLPCPITDKSVFTQSFPKEKKHDLNQLTQLLLKKMQNKEVVLSEYDYSIYQVYLPLLDRLRKAVLKDECTWRKWPILQDSHESTSRRLCWKFIATMWLFEILTNDNVETFKELNYVIALTQDLARRPGLAGYYDPLIISALISRAGVQLARQSEERFSYGSLKNILKRVLIPEYSQAVADEVFMTNIALANLRKPRPEFDEFGILELNYAKTIDPVSLNQNIAAWKSYLKVARTVRKKSEYPKGWNDAYKADYLFSKLVIAHDFKRFEELNKGVLARKNASQIAVMIWQEKRRRGDFPVDFSRLERYFDGKLPKDPYSIAHDFQWNLKDRIIYSTSQSKLKIKVD